MHAAKTNLSKLIALAESGEDVVILRGSTPVVRLVPVAPLRRRVFGALAGQVAVPPSFFEPLPAGELEPWER
jgi:prevent-host-death family protein